MTLNVDWKVKYLYLQINIQEKYKQELWGTGNI